MLAIVGVLNPVAVNALREVTLSIKEADSDKICILVARRLAVVTGQYPEAARIDRKALVEAVLGAEVRNQIVSSRLALLLREVRVECLKGETIAAQIGRIDRRTVQYRLTEATQHQTRIATGLLPQLRLEVLEQSPGGAVPAEEQVTSELGKARQGRRNDRRDL